MRQVSCFQCRQLGSALASVALLLAAPLAASGPQTLRLREVCEPGTVLTLVGVDTARDALLLAMRSRQPEFPGWWVELDTRSGTARLHVRDPGAGRTGGSVAAGPVLTTVPCGSGCRQVEAWHDGEWTTVGPPQSVPRVARLDAGYDRGGRPWSVAVTPTETRGRVRAYASRLEDRVWRPHGGLEVGGLGSPGIRLSPDDEAAILVGAGRFTAAGPPAAWLTQIPLETSGSQAVPIAGGAAAWLDQSGGLSLTVDGGATWRRAPRTEGGGGRDVEMRADLPIHSPYGRLPVFWTTPGGDRADGWSLELTFWSEAAGWQEVARLPEALPAGVSPGFEPQHVLARSDGTWVLIDGCADSPGGATLELVIVGSEGTVRLERPRLDPAWLD